MAIEGITQGIAQAVPAPQQQLLPAQLSAVSPEKSPRSPDDVLTISPEAMALSRQRQDSGPSEDSGVANQLGAINKNEVKGSQECQKCENRKYQDVSNDSTVSFQTPTRISPGAAESLVRAHEQEHVNNEQVKAGEQGRKVVAQSVAIHYAACSECGRSYVRGGTTTTVTAKSRSSEESSQSRPKGGSLNIRV